MKKLPNGEFEIVSVLKTIAVIAWLVITPICFYGVLSELTPTGHRFLYGFGVCIAIAYLATKYWKGSK
jgi:hypothetical protein